MNTIPDSRLCDRCFRLHTEEGNLCFSCKKELDRMERAEEIRFNAKDEGGSD